MSQPIGKRPRYRTKAATFYTDEKLMMFPPHGKLITDYLLTGPQVNRCGIFCFSPAKAQEDLGLSAKIFSPLFERILSELSWSWDRAARVLFIPTWWKYNLPDNPNALAASMEDLNVLPNTPLLKEFAANVRFLPANHLEMFTERITQRMGERYEERRGAQEQEQEQEQEQQQQQEKSPPSPPGEAGAFGDHSEPDSNPDHASPEWIVEQWNQISGVIKFTEQIDAEIRKRIQKQIGQRPTKDSWIGFFSKVAAGDWLCGRHDKGWRATLAWALMPKNVTNILAGTYPSKTGKPAQPGAGTPAPMQCNADPRGPCGLHVTSTMGNERRCIWHSHLAKHPELNDDHDTFAVYWPTVHHAIRKNITTDEAWGKTSSGRLAGQPEGAGR